jgi:hypothetical protein
MSVARLHPTICGGRAASAADTLLGKARGVRILIHPTADIVEVDGVECRLWAGKTFGGVPVEVYVRLIQVEDERNLSRFNRELAEQDPPEVVEADDETWLEELSA